MPKKRKVKEDVRDYASSPGLPSLWEESWSSAPQVVVCAGDVLDGPYSGGMMVNMTSFLGSLYWTSEPCDLGVEGVSYRVDVLFRFRLLLWVPSIDLWKSYRFLRYVLRALRDLPRSIARFLSCDTGAGHGQLGMLGGKGPGRD